MNDRAISLPPKKWSIVALGTAGMTVVVLSYTLAIVLAIACLALPVLLFGTISAGVSSLLVARLLLSAFGIAAGLTILWSLVPRRNKVAVNGVLIDLKKEPRLAGELEAIASAMKEPMPSEVYLVPDANAFVMEAGGFAGWGRRRIIGLGLPLLQMLSIAQFRAVLAHEFGHYYAGDTRLGPWVYSTRSTIARVYQNLGRKSDVISFLTRWAVVAAPYMVLMGAMRGYWTLFLRITQAISRQQEFRSDELACHVAGSQALIEGLQNIRRCHSFLNAYWTSVVLPVASGGFQPQLADGFSRFMNAPQIAKASADYLANQGAIEKPSQMDTHPPLSKRVERAQSYNLPAPDFAGEAGGLELPMISLIDQLPSLEGSLLKKFVPALADKELKSVPWESAGVEVFVPRWRKLVANHAIVLSTKALNTLPALVSEPREISNRIENPPGMFLNQAQRDAKAHEVLYCALVICLIDNGWKLVFQPGMLYLECQGIRIEPGVAFAAMKSGKLPAAEWESNCAKWGIGDRPLAPAPSAQQVSTP